MIRRMILSLPIAIVIGLSAQVAGQENKIPDQPNFACIWRK